MEEGIRVNAEVLGGTVVKCYQAPGSFNRSLHGVILLSVCVCQIMCSRRGFEGAFNCRDRGSVLLSRIQIVFATGFQFQHNILRNNTLTI